MKIWNDSEMQMSQWTPRRPSDRLTRAIFKPPCPESDVREPGWAVLAAREWAAGLAGCLALLVAGLPGDGGTARGRLADQAAFPLLCALSNQQSAAYHSTRAHSEWNHCARPLLEWTNTSRSTSSMGSFSPRSAN